MTVVPGIQGLRRDRASVRIAASLGAPLRCGASDGRMTMEKWTGLEAAEPSLTRYIGELDSELGRDAMAPFRSDPAPHAELHLIPESLRTCAEVDR